MMKYSLTPYAIMEYGQRKDKDGNPHQEDAMWPVPDAMNEDTRLFVLCDGMGGHEAGEVASQTVCETLGRSLHFDNHGLLTDDTLQKGMADAYSALDARDVGGTKKMGTTMTLLALDAAGAVVAHLGDSRVYHFRPGATREETVIIHRTEDHSVVNEMVRLGEMTEEEARHAPNKNVITRAMQPNMERSCRADVFQQSDIMPGDYFMLCSDGILEQLTDDNLRFIFSQQGGDAENKVNILREQTQHNSDNHTAIIVHITAVEGEPEPRPADSDAKYSLLAFPNGRAMPPVTIKTVSTAAVMPQPMRHATPLPTPTATREAEPITWKERKPERTPAHNAQHRGRPAKKRPIGAWIVAGVCVIALIAVIWICLSGEDNSAANNSNGAEEVTVDVGYEEVNQYNRRQEAEQSAINEAARQAQSSSVNVTGPEEAVGDPNEMWSSTEEPTQQETPSVSEGVAAAERVESAVQGLKRGSQNPDGSEPKKNTN